MVEIFGGGATLKRLMWVPLPRLANPGPEIPIELLKGDWYVIWARPPASMLMVAECCCCIMGGVGANFVVEEVFEGSGGVIAVSNKAGIVQSLMSFGRKADLFLEQELYKYDAVCLQWPPLGIMELLIW
jgi:hypothetical protein